MIYDLASGKVTYNNTYYCENCEKLTMWFNIVDGFVVKNNIKYNYGKSCCLDCFANGRTNNASFNELHSESLKNSESDLFTWEDYEKP